MKQLILTIGVSLVFFFVRGQNFTRALHFSLTADRSFVYDSLFFANDWRKQLAANFKKQNIDLDSIHGKDWLNKMLKVGDPMPDIVIDNILNYKTGKVKISDFKGKIVILDFWATSCSGCIASFPKMVKLQEKFKDQIQIILVNVEETEVQIRRQLGKDVDKISNLPFIISKQLFPYFPRTFLPYHVWIDQQGIVRVMGSQFNTYEKKIQDLIEGKEVFSWQGEATRPGFNPNIPYANLVGVNSGVNKFSSFFTSYNKDYSPKGDVMGSFVLNKTDSLNQQTRNTFVNWTIQKLYSEAFKPNLPSHKNYIFNPFLFGFFEVKDSSRYSDVFDYIPVDTAFVKSRFCYEQFCPLEASEIQRRKMMVEDLNNYFGKLYGTSGRVEKKFLPGYVVIKLPGRKYKRIYSKDEGYSEKQIIKHGKKWILYQGINLGTLFEGKIMEQLKTSRKMLINETGIDANQKIDIEIPYQPSLYDIKQALKPYGLDIIERDTEVELLVISDTKAK